MIELPLTALLLWAPPPAAERARDAYDDDRFEDAARAFAEAYAQTQDIAYLFAEGRSWALAGNCDAAIQRFEAFLAAQPESQAQAAARDELRQCGATPPALVPNATPADPTDAATREASDDDPTVGPPAVRDPSPSQTEVSAPERTEDTRPWARDPLGGVLAGLGVAGVASGATLAIVARGAQQRADQAPDVMAYGRHNDRAVAMSTASVPVLVVGGALLAGAALRYTLLARRRRPVAVRHRLWTWRF